MPVGELAEVLRDFGVALCQPSLEVDGDVTRLMLEFPLIQLQTVELSERLRDVVDRYQLRLIADRYGIDPAPLELALDSALKHRRADGS